MITKSRELGSKIKLVFKEKKGRKKKIRSQRSVPLFRNAENIGESFVATGNY